MPKENLTFFFFFGGGACPLSIPISSVLDYYHIEECYTSQFFFFFKIWFPNDMSQSHVIYHFGKRVIISWDDDTSFENHF
jgi:hypothetical protein